MAKLTLSAILGQYASTTELNNNFDLIETALENTLSRDGTSPNTMSAVIDMNSNQINNLAQPTNDNDAARKKDIDLSISTGLPDQTGQANKVFKTNGTTATWQTQSASDVSNTPAGNIIATTVQAAINELDTEKVGLAGTETITGDKTFSGSTTIDNATISAGTITGITDLAIADGGTGASTAQAAIDALSQVAGATNEYILTKDTASGNALWKINTGAADGTITPVKLSTGQFGGDYIKLTDTKAANTAGGTFTSGAWQTRDLTTEDNDTGNHCSLASNQFTLAAGTYQISVSAPAYKVTRHKAKLRNISDSTDELIGTSANSNAADTTATDSLIKGQFTIASSKIFEIQHQAQTTRSTDGFGVESNFGVNEVYTIAELWKVI